MFVAPVVAPVIATVAITIVATPVVNRPAVATSVIAASIVVAAHVSNVSHVAAFANCFIDGRAGSSAQPDQRAATTAVCVPYGPAAGTAGSFSHANV
ncbi:MAG TPA: hypothetical protein VM782_10810, partial [Stellaceae bacterium]|nr:hypothetical protein [Stellaceae bacterium]